MSTKRADKINSDEEERLRLGYEIKTGVRFAEYGGRSSSRIARIIIGGKVSSNADVCSRGDVVACEPWLDPPDQS